MPHRNKCFWFVGICKFVWRSYSLSIPFTWGFMWCLFSLRRRKMKKWFQNLIWLLWKQTKSFFSSGFELIALPFKSLWMYVCVFSFSIFKVDLVGYRKKTCLIYFFILRDIFFYIFSYLTLWSLILGFSCWGVNNAHAGYFSDIFQLLSGLI